MLYLTKKQKEILNQLMEERKPVYFKEICAYLGWDFITSSYRKARMKLLNEEYEIETIKGVRPNDLKYVFISKKEGRINTKIIKEKEKKKKERAKKKKQLEKEKLLNEKREEKQKLKEKKLQEKEEIIIKKREEKKRLKEKKLEEQREQQIIKQQIKEKKIEEQKQIERQNAIKKQQKIYEQNLKDFDKKGKKEKSYIILPLINKRYSKYTDKLIMDILHKNKGQITVSFVNLYKYMGIDLYSINQLLDSENLKILRNETTITYKNIKYFLQELSLTLRKSIESSIKRLDKNGFIKYDFSFYVKDKNNNTNFNFEKTPIFIDDLTIRDDIINMQNDLIKNEYDNNGKNLYLKNKFEDFKEDMTNLINENNVVSRYTKDKIVSYYKGLLLTQTTYSLEYTVKNKDFNELKKAFKNEIIKGFAEIINNKNKNGKITETEKILCLDLLKMFENDCINMQLLIDKYKK